MNTKFSNKRKILGLTLTLSFLIFAALFTFIPKNFDQNEKATNLSNNLNFPNNFNENTNELQTSEISLEPWWNSSFQHRRLINITNPYGVAINDFLVSIEFNYEDLVAAGKMNSSLKDIRIVEDDQVIDYYVKKDFNKTVAQEGVATVWFLTNVTADGNHDVFLYYNNDSVGRDAEKYRDDQFGLLNRWDFEEGSGLQILDCMGTNNGNFTTGGQYPDWATDAKVGSRSLEYDGNNDYVALETPYSSFDALTLSAWVKIPSGFDYTDQGIIISYDRSELFRFGIGSSEGSGNSGGWKVTFDTESRDMVGETSLTPNEWYHVVAVFDGSQSSGNRKLIYVNGENDGYSSKDSGQDDALDRTERYGFLSDGSEASSFDGNRGPNVPFYGKMDDLRLYDRALTSEEIGWINKTWDLETILNEEQAHRANIIARAVDLNDQYIPNANISIYSDTNDYITSGIADDQGTYTFTNLDMPPVSYHFKVYIESTADGTSLKELVNETSSAIQFTSISTNIDIICEVSTHIFNIKDADDKKLESGYILVGNSTQYPQIQNVSISDGSGRFWWVNTTPYSYNYSVYYVDSNYNPNPVQIESGDLTTPNTDPSLVVNMTTLTFTVYERDTMNILDIGVDLIFKNYNNEEIASLVSNESGIATYRWLNSSSERLGGQNVTLDVTLFGQDPGPNFNISEFRVGSSNYATDPVNFTITTENSYSIWLDVTPGDYTTDIISLNPSDTINIKWGSDLKLRALFNVTKSAVAGEVGLNWADSMTYQVKKGGSLILSGSMDRDDDNIGQHEGTIKSSLLDSDQSYSIIISGEKAGYQDPTEDITLQLYVAENDILVNQSQNNNSAIETYWDEDVSMSVKAYGQYDEFMTVEGTIYESNNYDFRFSIPDIENVWNLTEITFDIDDISWTEGSANAYILITDPWGETYNFTQSNSTLQVYPGDDPGYCYNMIIPGENLIKSSPTGDNQFNFSFYGTYDNAVDITAEARFVRDQVDVYYRTFNVSDLISIPYDEHGWAIKRICFDIYNFKNTSDWSVIDPSTVDLKIRANQNYTATSRFTYDLLTSSSGTGQIIIDNATLYPDENLLFDFSILSSDPNVMFDVDIDIDYIQYYNEYSIINNYTITQLDSDIANYEYILINPQDSGWDDEQTAALYISDVFNATDNFNPNDVNMTITIGTEVFTVNEDGEILLSQVTGFSKNITYSASISTDIPVNFTISFQDRYSRQKFIDLENDISSASYQVDVLSGSVSYNSVQNSFIQLIDTSALEGGDPEDYDVRFTIGKEHYEDGYIDLPLEIYARPTEINGESLIFIQKSVYVWQSANITLEYNDTRRTERISDADKLLFIWKRLDANGRKIEEGISYNITETADSRYVLDFDTENRAVGTYQISAQVGKDNYIDQTATIYLEIKERPILILPYSFQLSVDHGDAFQLTLQLTDSVDNTPIDDANVILTLGGRPYVFTPIGNGLYQLSIQTGDLDAFFADLTLSGTLQISKPNYVDVSVNFNAIVNMQEIFEGVPLFYFILGVSLTITVIAAVAIYRYAQLAKIPEFVKKARKIKKEIKAKEAISEENLYPSKDEFTAEQYGDEWKELGLSIEDSLGLEKKMKKRLGTKLPKKGGAQ
ncbi:MAG: hypothetical protein GF364_16215 [Candidatus Lokiarchaeota archaeon]|nr:hypothetical protein [Candidatus Lokiarchaeota archaeon]